MTQEQEDRSDARKLEIFLDTAFKLDNRFSRAYPRELPNLIDAEKGVSTKTLGSAEKQLNAIKERLLKAINIFVKHATTEDEKKEISSWRNLVGLCENSDDIVQLVRKGLPYVIKIPKMKR